MAKWDERREQLETRLADLRSRLTSIEDELDTPAPKDDEDRATEREDDEVLERVGSSGLKEIRMIEAALKRIEEDTFGACQRCGDEISEERLDLLPFTPFCRTCAAEVNA